MNIAIHSGFTHWKWWFSHQFFCMFTRGYPQKPIEEWKSWETIGIGGSNLVNSGISVAIKGYTSNNDDLANQYMKFAKPIVWIWGFKQPRCECKGVCIVVYIYMYIIYMYMYLCIHYVFSQQYDAFVCLNMVFLAKRIGMFLWLTPSDFRVPNQHIDPTATGTIL